MCHPQDLVKILEKKDDRKELLYLCSSPLAVQLQWTRLGQLILAHSDTCCGKASPRVPLSDTWALGAAWVWAAAA